MQKFGREYQEPADPDIQLELSKEGSQLKQAWSELKYVQEEEKDKEEEEEEEASEWSPSPLILGWVRKY